MSIIPTTIFSRAAGVALAAALVLTGSLAAAVPAHADSFVDLAESQVALPELEAGTPTIRGDLHVGQTLVSDPGAWPEEAILTYQWLADGAEISGAQSDSLVLTPDHEGQTIALRVSGELEGFAPSAATSAFSAPISAGRTTTGSVSVLGTPAVGSSLAVSTTEWAAGTTFSYQWYVESTKISGATAPKYTLTAAQKDKRIKVVVNGHRAGYEPRTAVSAFVGKVLTAGKPSVSGAAIVGSTLTAKANTWTAGTSLSYQWYANGTVISGATKSTYVLSTYRSGQKVTVKVTGKKSGYSTASMTSSSTAYVMRASTPSISGALAYGSTVSAKVNTWTSGSSFKYQWYADGKSISGATKSTFKIGSSQKAKQLSVKVTGYQTGHTTVAKTSSKSAKVMTASTPSISGTRAVGSTLTAKVGTWTSSTKFTYQWYSSGAAISGATKSTYKLSSSREHKQITVKVTGKRTGYATVAKTSSATSRILKTATPSISGSTTITKTLTAKVGSWSSGTAFKYQWYVNGTAIKGASKSTLKLPTSYAGKTIKVKVTGSKSGYPTVSKVSKSTNKVGYPSSTTPASLGSCPSWAPIKGNESSMIYHMKGQRFYNATNPEECFRTESAAVKAGYRKAKV